MKRFSLVLLVVLLAETLFAGSVTIVFLNGKKIKGKIVKIEAGDYGSEYRGTAYAMTVAEGVSELRIPFTDIRSVRLKSQGDVSCFEDSTISPTRKFCTSHAVYTAVLAPKKGAKKTKKKAKRKAEVVDERVFDFYIEGMKKPVSVMFAKIKVSNAGQEGKIGYPELEQQVLKLRKQGVKSIIFSQ